MKAFTEIVIKKRELKTIDNIEVYVNPIDLSIKIIAGNSSIAYMCADSDSGKYVHLSLFHVDSKIRKCGLGTEMMMGFIELIKGKYYSMSLYASPGEQSGKHIKEGNDYDLLEKDELIAFYKKFGFIEGVQEEGKPCFLELFLHD